MKYHLMLNKNWCWYSTIK